MLGAVQNLPTLVFGLLIGVWVDRSRRQPMLVWAYVGRAVFLTSIPVAAFLDILSLHHLYVVGFLAGTLVVVFDAALTSFLPAVVERKDLVESNSKLQLSHSASSIVGPGIAGWLVQLITAPFAILVGVGSLLTAAFSFTRIRVEEVRILPPEQKTVWRDIREGLRILLRSPILRALSLPSCLSSFALSVQQTVLILFFTRELGIGPVVIGIIISSTGIASFIGAFCASAVEQRLGPGPSIITGACIGGVGLWIIPFVNGSTMVAVIILVVAQLLFGFGSLLYTIHQVSLRQAVTPNRLLGRVTASRRFLVTGMGPLGALTGGVLGEAIGLRSTLIFSAICGSVMIFWLILTPLRTLREQPTQKV